VKLYSKYLIIYKIDNVWKTYIINSYDKALNLLNKLSKNHNITDKQLKPIGKVIS
jgi:hypothetical protein